MFGLDPVFILLMIVIFGGSAFVQYMLKSKFKKYSQVPLASGMTGAEVAQKMLDDHGIRDVMIVSTPGQLTDHYNPKHRTVNLSDVVYGQNSVAAAAVAAHECGHAIQHANTYAFLGMRSALVPIVSLASRYMQWILLAGIVLLYVTPIPLAIGVLMFATTTLFSFITLPVEFDASNRALRWLDRAGITGEHDHAMAKNALFWAAMTYVVAALASLATLLYYASFLIRRR